MDILSNRIEFNSREDLPRIFNERGLTGIGVEVGVLRANFLSYIRRNWQGKMLYGVDEWKPYFGADWGADTHEMNYTIATHEIQDSGMSDTCKLLRMDSIGAAKKFTEDCVVLDFVYLDAAHDYISVSADIMAWWPLIKSGGILCGHDWILDGWHVDGDPFKAYDCFEDLPNKSAAALFGVRRSVMHHFSSYPICTSSDKFNDGYQSWAVVKP